MLDVRILFVDSIHQNISACIPDMEQGGQMDISSMWCLAGYKTSTPRLSDPGTGPKTLRNDWQNRQFVQRNVLPGTLYPTPSNHRVNRIKRPFAVTGSFAGIRIINPTQCKQRANSRTRRSCTLRTIECYCTQKLGQIQLKGKSTTTRSEAFILG
jgi:hypothetical protein